MHAIGPLDFDETRRENVLRGAGYAWTPGLCEMDKNCPCVVCSKLYERNGFHCVELVRLIH